MTTENTNVTNATTKTRGRIAKTQEQKDAEQKVYNLFHGEGKHTLSVGIKVSPDERSMLRSFAKKVSTADMQLGIDDVFAATLRNMFLGVMELTYPDTLDFLFTGIAEQSKKVNELARQYERENETGELGKLRKQAEQFAEMKSAFTNRGMPVPQSINDAIDAVYALIDALTMEEGNSNETTEEGINETNDGRI